MRLGAFRNAVLAITMVAAGVVLMVAPAQGAVAQPTRATASASGTMTSSVQGTFTDAVGGTGAVTGTFVPTRFTSTSSQVLATGELTATLVDSIGRSVGTATQTVTLPLVRGESGGDFTSLASCEVLDLVLGPLDLNLLGVMVHLDRVHLNITAVTGPGNLLGNLLCAVLDLLNGTGNLGTIANLLNVILALLNG
jgi:hypothetical protein